jgi:hypothetical protein
VPGERDTVAFILAGKSGSPDGCARKLSPSIAKNGIARNTSQSNVHVLWGSVESVARN